MSGFSYGGGGGASDPLVLANTTAALGQVQQTAGIPLLHTYGSTVAGERNLFLGEAAGNFTLSGAIRNIGLGYMAGRALTSGDNNIGAGYRALYSVTSGASNIGLGTDALVNLDLGNRNVALGHFAGTGLANASDNIAIGYAAASSGLATRAGTVSIGASAGVDSTANYGISIGQEAGTQLVGEGSIAIGYQALDNTLTGAEKNVAIGYQSGTAITTGKNNTGVGYLALKSVITGSNNVGIGAYAGDVQVINGHDNTIVGNYAGASGSATTDYSYSVFLGTSAGAVLTAKGNKAIAIGYLAAGNSNADNFVAIGYNAGRNLIGDGSIAIGHEALDATIAGAAFNTAVGYQAGTALTSGGSNTLFGYMAGSALTTHSENTCLGYKAGEGHVSASNVFIGFNTGRNTGSGGNNVVIGAGAGYTGGALSYASVVGIGGNALAGSNAINTVALGYNAGQGLVGDGSVVIGYQSFDGTQAGAARNTGVGYQTGTAVTTGTDNVFCGYQAGDLITTGSKNTFIGEGADGSANSRTGAIALGYAANVAADYVGVFGAANGSGNAAGELNAIGVGTASPTLFWQTDEMSGMTTDLGGYAIKLINKTGANSVKGTLVSADTTADDACKLTPLDGLDTIGVMWSDGVADGSSVWVVVSGIAQVKFGAAATRGQFARQSITTDTGAAAGIATAEAAPTTPFATDNHFREVGHVIQSIGAAGLARCVVHFN